MTGWRFILRSLAHHGRIHVTVALGVAAATAVLTGALVVGDSVRGSLQRLTLDRLGRIDDVLVTERFFRAELATELAADPGFRQHFTAAIPALLLPRVSLEKAGQRPHARASQVTLIGSGPEFWEAGHPAAKPAVLPAAGQIVLNAPLAEDLGAVVGDEVILHLPKANQVPADSPLGRRSDRLHSLAGLQVVAIVPADGLGRFSLQSSQAAPRNAYLALQTLQQALDQETRVNAVLVTGVSADAAPGADAEAALAAALQPRLEDYGLRLQRVRRTFPETGGDRADVVYDYFDLTTSRLLFEPAARQAIEQALAAEHVQPVLTYLATSIGRVTEGQTAGASIPYSLLTAVDSRPPLGPLATAASEWVASLADDELVLNSWAASDLQATPGDRIRVTFFEPETAHGELHERSADFTLRAIVPLTEPATPYRRNRPARYAQRPQLANDPQLTPEVQGLTDQDSISNWDAPFPVDYHRVRRQDDVYWQQHRTTPKAFVSLAAGRRLWGSRFGDTTSFRIPVSAGLEPGSSAEREFRRSLESRVLDELGQRRAALGFSFVPVKARGLAASAGTTPFDVLFLLLSFFVIAAALLLVALLFRLGVERRAEEVGTLLALGLGRRRIGRWFWLEGGCVAALGGVLGIGAGVGYAWLLLAGLRTWWWGAVQTSALGLSVSSWSLALGYLSGVCVSLLTIAASVRSLRRIPVRRLLAGEAAAETGPLPAVQAARQARRHAVPVGLVLAAIGLSVAAVRWGGEAQAGAFVGAGTLLLAALLIALRTRLRSWSARAAGAASLRLGTLAVRNAARNPGRSTATIGLMAVACFLIVAMSAFRLEPSVTGTGGFDLIAESAEPIFADLNRAEARRELLGDDADRLADCTILGLRVQPGDDASCNNLYRPAQPRVLGVTESWIRHFDQAQGPAFAWAGSAAVEPADRANPWRLLAADATERRAAGRKPAGDTNTGPPSAGDATERRAAGRKPAGDTNTGPPSAGDVAVEDAPVPVVLDKNTALYSLQLYGGVGEVFEIAYADRTIRFRVAGLLSNSILQGSLLIGERDLVRLYPSVSGVRFFLIRVPPGAEPAPSRPPPGYRGGDVAATSHDARVPRAEQVAAVLEERLSDQGFDAVPAPRRLADLLAVQNTYLSTFQSLGALGLLLGTFGLAAVQARNVLERRRELGLLRAVGFRAARLAGLVMLENVALLVGGLLTGTLAALVALLPQLFGGGAAVPWRDLAIMLAAVLLVGVLAGLGTIRTALRAEVLAALRGD